MSDPTQRPIGRRTFLGIAAYMTLRGVLADRCRLAAMRQACRAVAQERYSLERMCESYWSVFTDLLRTQS